MLIDWFTVVAQALNFLILVWLMKRFLYRPVLDAIDAREQRIAAQVADAEAKERDAAKQRDAYSEKNAAIDEQRAALLRHAADDAAAESERLMSHARATADEWTVKRRAALSSEAQNLQQALRNRTRHGVFAIARKALTDLASESLEARVTEVFVQRLAALDEPTRTALAAAFAADAGSVVVRSAFELAPDQRAAIQEAVDKTFSAKVAIRYETAPDLIGGIELRAGGHEVAWSIDSYLSTLETEVGALLDDKAPTGPAREQKLAPEVVAADA